MQGAKLESSMDGELGVSADPWYSKFADLKLHGCNRYKRIRCCVPRRVPLELLDLEHARVLPEAQLVLAEAVGRDELLVMLRPLEGAHLQSVTVQSGSRIHPQKSRQIHVNHNNNKCRLSCNVFLQHRETAIAPHTVRDVVYHPPGPIFKAIYVWYLHNNNKSDRTKNGGIRNISSRAFSAESRGTG